MPIQKRINHQDKVGEAVRYGDFGNKKWFFKSAGKKIYIEPAAIDYLAGLNSYDQLQVHKGIEDLSSMSSPIDGYVNKHHPAFFKAKQASATSSNFIIKYSVSSDYVVIMMIALNQGVLGAKAVSKDERTALYDVSKTSNIKFNSAMSLEDIDSIPRSWRVNQGVTKVKTQHAAVNGMLNNLGKAGWLMGVHAEHAYSGDDIKNYTLFHNPSESPVLDFYESVRDNIGLTTENAKYLAAVLADIQRQGKEVKWVVHSQGGIIFKQAVAYHLKRYPGQTLSKNTVVFHSGGNNKRITDKVLENAGIKKVKPDNDNPFDLVPNIAGGNHIGLGALGRSAKFSGKVFGNGKSVVESPHTMPFISLEAYHQFLVMAGDNRSAKRVQLHMQSLAGN